MGAASVLKTVERALRLLLLFDKADQEYRVGELAAMLDVDTSVASRLAATLPSTASSSVPPITARFCSARRSAASVSSP